jgi:hypothetical protein
MERRPRSPSQASADDGARGISQDTRMTRLVAQETCVECGSLLVPPELASGLRVAANADYVCLECGRAYGWTKENPPRLTLLAVAGQNDDARTN